MDEELGASISWSSDMEVAAAVAAFGFKHRKDPVSLYDYAPVLQTFDQVGTWVLKRTGLVHSSGEAIGHWLTALRVLGLDVVAPAAEFRPNPRRLADGKEWVVYPFVRGEAYLGSEEQIGNAGRLLGRMHAASPPEAKALTTYREPLLRDAAWIDRHRLRAEAILTKFDFDKERLRDRTSVRLAGARPVQNLPLAGCSFDFKASNLVFCPKPVLVDPDHAARMPRLSDLAIALLLFHCDCVSAPGRLWRPDEWAIFLRGYGEHVVFDNVELASWNAVLELAWLDQGLWLLGNWPEGWDGIKNRGYLLDLLAFNPAHYPLAS